MCGVVGVVAAAAIATAACVVVHSAAGVVALMPLPPLSLMSSVFDAVLQLVG